MGDKQESVSQGESKHNLPARGLALLCVPENPECACVYLIRTRQALGKGRLPREPRTWNGGCPQQVVAEEHSYESACPRGHRCGGD